MLIPQMNSPPSAYTTEAVPFLLSIEVTLLLFFQAQTISSQGYISIIRK